MSTTENKIRHRGPRGIEVAFDYQANIFRRAKNTWVIVCFHVFVAYAVRPDIVSTWAKISLAIGQGRDVIHTTQMALLSTGLFKKGYRIFLHPQKDKGDCYEIRLGSQNTCTSREIRIEHNLLKLWEAGEFSMPE